MTRKIKGYKITSGKDMIEKERKRLLNLKNDSNWLRGREFPLDWMKKQFGETLTEKDGMTHPNGSRFNDHDCSVCDEEIDYNEKIVNFNFSFCEEYDCGMNICINCLKKLTKELDVVSGDKEK